MLNNKNPAKGGKTQNNEFWYFITITLIAFIVIGLTISIFVKKEKKKESYDTTRLENIINEIKIEKITTSESKSQGKIISPVSRYEVDQLRQNLNLPDPEEEKNNIKLQHEETLKNNKQIQYVF